MSDFILQEINDALLQENDDNLLLDLVTPASKRKRRADFMLLKQSTTRDRLIMMVDSTDHVTGKTGLTLTITASKNGAAFASITPTVTERGNGWYSLALTTAHTDTLGDFGLHITGTAADATDLVDQVVVDLPGATVTSVTGAVGSVTGAVGSVTGAVGSVTGAVGSVTGNVGGNVVGSVGSVTSVTDKTGYSLSAAGVDAVLDEVVEGSTTLRQSVRLANAANAGKVNGAGTSTVNIRDLSDSKNRISATVDASGNRTAVTTDVT